MIDVKTPVAIELSTLAMKEFTNEVEKYCKEALWQCSAWRVHM